jgi:broad-specificity NMP kinase
LRLGIFYGTIFKNGRMNILIIGPMGVGKTTIAKLVADKLKSELNESNVIQNVSKLKHKTMIVTDEDRWNYYPQFGYTKERADIFLQEHQYVEMIKDREEIDKKVFLKIFEEAKEADIISKEERSHLVFDVAPTLLFLKQGVHQEMLFQTLTDWPTKVFTPISTVTVLLLPDLDLEYTSYFLASRLKMKGYAEDKLQTLIKLNKLFLEDPILLKIISAIEQDKTGRLLLVGNTKNQAQTVDQISNHIIAHYRNALVNKNEEKFGTFESLH